MKISLNTVSRNVDYLSQEQNDVSDLFVRWNKLTSGQVSSPYFEILTGVSVGHNLNNGNGYQIFFTLKISLNTVSRNVDCLSQIQNFSTLEMFKSFKMVKFKTFHWSPMSFKTWRQARGTGLLINLSMLQFRDAWAILKNLTNFF